MDITSIKIDEDRGQVTLVVHDPVSGLRWGVFPEPDEQGPQRADESDADYAARLAALVEVLRERAIANPAPGAGQPPREKREPRELIDPEKPIGLTDGTALAKVSGFRPADRAKLEAFKVDRAKVAVEAAIIAEKEV